MRANRQLEEMEKLKKAFIKIRNEKTEEEEYYRVILSYNIGYEGYGYSVDSIPIEYSKIYDVTERNIFGNFVTKQKSFWNVRSVGVYAVKDKDGIREMVTGIPLSPYDETGELYCCGLTELGDISKAGEDLKFIDSYKHYKEQYVKKLLEASKILHDKWEILSKQQREKDETEEDNIQYFKYYRKPQ